MKYTIRLSGILQRHSGTAIKRAGINPPKVNLLDYFALILIITGFSFIFTGFLFGGILFPVGVFLELVASCVGRKGKERAKIPVCHTFL